VVISADELLQLRGLYTAIRDGETTIAAVFEELESEKTEKTKTESIRDKLRERKKVTGPAAAAAGVTTEVEPAPETPTPAAAPAPPEAKPGPKIVAPAAEVGPFPTSVAAPSGPPEPGLRTAVGTLLETTNVKGQHYAILKEGGKFRLEGAPAIQAARRRINKTVIIHYEFSADGTPVVAAIEND
jgi:hypothetical protein